MAMKNRASTSVMLFDVVYEDGTRNSNRRVLASSLGAGDEAAQAAIEEQDRAIAASSGRPRSNIKSVVRSPIKAASSEEGSNRKVKGKK